MVHGRPRLTASQNFPPSPASCPFTSAEGSQQWLEYLRDSRNSILAHIREIALENEAFLFDTTGNLCGQYVKRNLWHPERDYLSPGDPKGEVFDTPWGRIGFLICQSRPPLPVLGRPR